MSLRNVNVEIELGNVFFFLIITFKSSLITPLCKASFAIKVVCIREEVEIRSGSCELLRY